VLGRLRPGGCHRRWPDCSAGAMGWVLVGWRDRTRHRARSGSRSHGWPAEEEVPTQDPGVALVWARAQRAAAVRVRACGWLQDPFRASEQASRRRVVLRHVSSRRLGPNLTMRFPPPTAGPAAGEGCPRALPWRPAQVRVNRRLTWTAPQAPAPAEPPGRGLLRVRPRPHPGAQCSSTVRRMNWEGEWSRFAAEARLGSQRASSLAG
jgi:hypothetical protein